MVFLSPLFLIGLLAATIPIAIHLIRREKPPKLMFSSIRFLKKTSRKLILFQHIQQWLLLLLRSVLIALLVFAFARPLIDQTVARLLDADPRSVVILLDTSMSMRYGNTFERARDAALDIVDELGAGDEVALIGFSDSVEWVREFNTDLNSMRGYINSLDAAGYGATRIMPNLRLADQLLSESRYENRSVYLISDFQEFAIAGSEDGWTLGAGVALNNVDVAAVDSRNLALTDVRSPEQLLEDASAQQILARVRTTGTQYVDTGEVTLLINGQLVERTIVDLSDRSEEVVSFTADFGEEGSYVGEVRLTGDSYDADNAFYFTVDVLPKISVLAVNGEASENWFDDEGHWFGLAVSSALESPFELAVVEPNALSAAALRQHDVLVLLNVGTLSDSQAAAISDYVLNGGSVLFAPGDRIQADEFNRQFADIAPANLQAQDLSNREDYLVIADYDRRHPILRPLDTTWSARFQGHWSLQAHPDAAVLMQFDNTEPALVERNVGEGKTILFASAMDLEWNNLALQGLFLPFIHETLRHLVQPEFKQRAYQVGDRISLNPSDEAISVSATDPLGDAIRFDNDSFVVSASLPGFIEAEADGRTSHYAVNTISEESYFARTAPSTLYDRVINDDTNPLQSREVRTQQLMEEIERPQRIWWWILMLAMMLVISELLVANRTYR